MNEPVVQHVPEMDGGYGLACESVTTRSQRRSPICACLLASSRCYCTKGHMEVMERGAVVDPTPNPVTVPAPRRSYSAMCSPLWLPRFPAMSVSRLCFAIAQTHGLNRVSIKYRSCLGHPTISPVSTNARVFQLCATPGPRFISGNLHSPLGVCLPLWAQGATAARSTWPALGAPTSTNFQGPISQCLAQWECSKEYFTRLRDNLILTF